MNDFLQFEGYLPESKIKLKSFVMDLQVQIPLNLIISFKIKSGPALLPVFNFLMHLFTSLMVNGLSVISQRGILLLDILFEITLSIFFFNCSSKSCVSPYFISKVFLPETKIISKVFFPQVYGKLADFCYFY